MKTIAKCLVLLLISASSIGAQDVLPPTGGQTEQRMVIAAQSDDGGEVQMSAIQLTSDGNGNVLSFVAPEPMALPGGMAMATGDLSAALINDPGIQQELELLADQKQQLAKVQNEFGREMKSVIDDVMRNKDSDKSQLGGIISDLQKRQLERMNQILLPHQLDRLRQISFQRNVSQAGMSAVLSGKEIAEKLGIDAEQQKRLQTRAEELKKEFEQKVAKLKEEMKQELLQELTPEQRKQIEDMTGSPFEFKRDAGMRTFRSRLRDGRSEVDSGSEPSK